MRDNQHYYYLHTNGDLIHKPAFVVDSDPSCFDSPFVKHHWRLDLENRADAWRLVVEALAMGARLERVKELATKWGLNREDLPNFMVHNPTPSELQKLGLERFILEVLGLDYHKTLDEIAAMGNTKPA